MTTSPSLYPAPHIVGFGASVDGVEALPGKNHSVKAIVGTILQNIPQLIARQGLSSSSLVEFFLLSKHEDQQMQLAEKENCSESDLPPSVKINHQV